MAVDVANLQIEVDSKQVRAAIGTLAALEKQGATTENRFKSFGRTAQRMGRQMTMWLTAPILGAGAIAVKTAADYETLRTQLEVLVGSAETANTVFSDLTEFAATTPFEIDGIVRANNLLLGFGVSIDQTQELLRTLGDVAAVSGGDLFQMARITGEARAEGRLLTRDLRQLVAQGVPAIQLLAESMGVAEGQIFDLASAGEITFERLVAAFEMATDEGGLFFEGMEKRSNTLAGIFSNFADSVNISLASVGDTLVETLDIKDTMRELVTQIETATDWFNNLDESTQTLIVAFAGVTAAAGPLIGALGLVSLAIGAISLPLVATVAVVGSLTAAIVGWNMVIDDNTSLMNAQSAQAEGMAEAFRKNLKEMKEYADETGRAAGEIDEFVESFDAMRRSLEDRIEQIPMQNLELVEEYNQLERKISEAYGPGTSKVIEDFISRQNEIEDQIIANNSELAEFVSLLNDMGSDVDSFDRIGKLMSDVGKAIDLIGGKMREAFEPPSVGDLQQRIDILNQQIADSFDRDKIRGFQDEIEKLQDRIVFLTTQFERPGMERPLGGVIDNMREIEEMINSVDVSLADTYYPPGSIARIEQEIQDLIEVQRVMTDPSDFQTYQAEIDRLREKIQQLTGDTREQDNIVRDLGFTFSSAFEDAAINVRDLNDLLDVTKGLLQDVMRVFLRTTVTEPLGNALAGAFSNLGGGGSSAASTMDTASWANDMLGKVESTQMVDTAVIADNALNRTEGPSEMLSLKDFSPVVEGSKSKVNVNVSVVNNTSSQVEIQKQQKANGDIDIVALVRETTKGLHNSGQMDRTMSSNYGVRRQGRRVG